ncbi:MAG: type II toxin-antitoxin system RelE/ParE family toxin [Deltaproteobacteria bacterium]|nr:type II toxin-antitoxin system RelE/ParE family toxin [Deltaproteobacteria bacterium]
MSFTVFLSADASRDLEELYHYIARHDAPGKAEQVLSKIESAFESLSEYPERGVYPKELLSLGIRDYREVFFKPYRLIYRVISNRVYVLLIADGRRDMQTLLLRRLLEI